MTRTGQHFPNPGTVTDRLGAWCPAATPDSYPLTARCICGRPLTCADGTATWSHGTT